MHEKISERKFAHRVIKNVLYKTTGYRKHKKAKNLSLQSSVFFAPKIFLPFRLPPSRSKNCPKTINFIVYSPFDFEAEAKITNKQKTSFIVY